MVWKKKKTGLGRKLKRVRAHDKARSKHGGEHGLHVLETQNIKIKDLIIGKSSEGESEIKRKLDELKAAIQQAFDTHSRFWFYTLLEGAYALYDEWRAVRHSKKNAKKAARLFGVKVKKDAHPLSVIIKIVAPGGVDSRRWVDGLRFARKQGVAPKDLTAFLKANGGIAGCARKFHAG
jgi:hypothetical protein